MTNTVQQPVTRESNRPVRRIVALGLPMLVGALASLASGVVDTAMMGRYGAAELAAVSAASAVFDILTSVVLASLVGHQILSARFAGRQEPAGVSQSLRSSAVYCGGLAAILTLVCLVAGGRLAGVVSGQETGLRHIAAGYLTARAPSLLLLVAFTLLATTFNAYKRPQIPMVGAIVVNLTNLVLDWLLIYGTGPAPELGAVGNGLATTISWFCGLAFLMVAAFRFPPMRTSPAPRPAPVVGFTTSIPRLAWPAIVSQGLDYTGIAVFFVIIGGLGTAALGGGRIAFQLMVLVFGLFGVFSAACRILIGRAIGAHDVAACRAFWRAGQALLLAATIPVSALLIAAPAVPVALFTAFPPVVEAATRAVPMVGLSLPLMAWTLGSVSVLRALGRTRWDMYGNLVPALAVQLPIGWLLVEVAELGVAGAFAGLLCYWLARGLISELLAREAVRREVQLHRSPDRKVLP